MSEHPTLAIQRARVKATLESGDRATLRMLLEDGATFASFSIKTPTAAAEAHFARWLALGRPANLRRVRGNLRAQCEQRLYALRNLSDEEIERIARAGSPQAERIFAELTWGYGPAKASFALACAGFGRLACLDTRAIVKYSLQYFEPKWKKTRPSGWTSYLGIVGELYPGDDSASLQWAEWLTDQAARGFQTEHSFLTAGIA